MADLAAVRHLNLLDYLKSGQAAGVDALAAHLGVSAQTIRKDLDLLASRHLLTRVRGGAMLSAALTSGLDNIGYAARRALGAEAKDAIGKRAASLIPNNASLFINIGTTTEAVARHLRRHERLMVVTNNLNVADILADCAGIEVIVAGGRLRAADRALVGSLTVDFIKSFKVDYAVIGTSALDHDGDLLDYDISEVKVSQTIIANARKVMLVSDATKLGRCAPARIGSLADIDLFVTDRIDTPDFAELCRKHDVEVAISG